MHAVLAPTALISQGRPVRVVQLGVLLGTEPVNTDGVHGPLLLGPTHPAFPLPLYLVVHPPSGAARLMRR